jgi:hypothetical protein
VSRPWATQGCLQRKDAGPDPPSSLQVSVCVIIRGIAGERAASRSHCALVEGG